MDDIRFQHELQEIKRRVNEMTLRQMARSPVLKPAPMASSHDSFKAQLGDIRAHVDSLAASLTSHHTVPTHEDRFATFERRLQALEQSHNALESQVDGLQPILTPATSVTSFDGGAIGPTVELDASPEVRLPNFPSNVPSPDDEGLQVAQLKADLRREQDTVDELRRNCHYLGKRNFALRAKTRELQPEPSQSVQPCSMTQGEDRRNGWSINSEIFERVVNGLRETIRQERAELAHVTADRRLRQDEIDSLRAQLEHAQAAVRSKTTWIEDLYDKNKAHVAALEGEREVMRDITRARDLLMETLVSRDRTITDLEQKLDSAQQDHNSMLARRSLDVDRLQEFCEQKDTIIHQQAEVISRGGRLLQEKDDEIDTITKRLEAEKAKCMEQQDKLVAALMKKDHEILQLVAQPKQYETAAMIQPTDLPQLTERKPTIKDADQMQPCEKNPSAIAREASTEHLRARPPQPCYLPQPVYSASPWDQGNPGSARLWPTLPNMTPLSSNTRERDSHTVPGDRTVPLDSPLDSRDLSHKSIEPNAVHSAEIDLQSLLQPRLDRTTDGFAKDNDTPSGRPRYNIRKLPYQPREADVQWYNTMKVLKPQRLPLDYTRAPPLPMAPHKMPSEANLRSLHSAKGRDMRHRAIPRHQSLNDFGTAKKVDLRRLHAYAESEDEDSEQYA